MFYHRHPLIAIIYKSAAYVLYVNYVAFPKFKLGVNVSVNSYKHVNAAVNSCNYRQLVSINYFLNTP